MSKFTLVIGLMVIVAIIIVGMVIYVFTHLSSITATQVFILLGVAIVGWILIMGIILLLVRGIKAKK